MVTRIEIRNASIIDGTGRPALLQHTLCIEDSRITALLPSSASASSVPGTTVIDATGKTVMPGLIDAHCHLSYGEGRSSEEVDIFGGAPFSALRAAWNAGKVVGSGVTSVCDPGSTWDIAAALRDAVDTGMVAGPRIFAAGRHITTDGGFADPYPTWMGTPRSSEGVVCRSLTDMITEVRVQVKNRVDMIKISGDTVVKDERGVMTSCMSQDEMRGIVDEAHRLGRKVGIHARYATTVKFAVAAGVDWIYHASYAEHDDIQRAADAGVAICPTLAFTANIAHFGKHLGVHQGYIDTKLRELEALGKLIEACRKAGVKLMVGSETGFAITPYGEWHARELALMADVGGMHNAEVIHASTAGNAAAFGWEAQVGTLAPGRLADVLVVDGDPLANLAVLQDRKRIACIIKDGQVIPVIDQMPTRRQLSFERNLTISTVTLRPSDLAKAAP